MKVTKQDYRPLTLETPKRLLLTTSRSLLVLIIPPVIRTTGLSLVPSVMTSRVDLLQLDLLGRQGHALATDGGLLKVHLALEVVNSRRDRSPS